MPYCAEGFASITLVISVPNVIIANAASPVHTVSELLAAIYEEPEKASFGSSGAGQSPHLSVEMFMQHTQITATHIPYKGADPAVAALLANQFTFMIDNLPSSMPYIQSGKFRALADGAHVLVGGFGEVGIPYQLLQGLLEQSSRELTITSNNADTHDNGIAGLLLAGRVRKIICSHPRLLMQRPLPTSTVQAKLNWNVFRKAPWPNAYAPPAPVWDLFSHQPAMAS